MENSSEKNEPNKTIPKIDRPHLVDLDATPKGSVLENVPLIYSSVTYLIFFKKIIQHLFLTILFDWTAMFTRPVNFLLTFVIFPLIAVVLFFGEIFLKFVSYMKWDTNDSDGVIQDWSKLTSSPSELLDNLHLGMNTLNNDPPSENKFHKGFNLNQSIFLLFLSVLLQDRNEKKLKEAHKMLTDFKNSLKNKNNDNNTKDDLQKIQKINGLLKESEERIVKQLTEFNLNFTSLSELNSLGGPYAGMFWPAEEGNFIIIVFKGTTMTNFNEWLTDTTLQRMDARSYLFGEVHEGYYSQLYPTDEYDSTRVDRRCPATRIIEAVRQKGEIIRKRNMEKDKTTLEETALVNVYITGHSLGGALATLLYARLLKSPQSLGDHCVLRDGTTFASPPVGDGDFAAEFASLCNKSVDEYKRMWRIVNDNDFAQYIPPGYHHPRLRRYAEKIHVMNYFHVGDEIRFYQDGSYPSSMRNIFDRDKEFLFIENGFGWKDWRSLFGFYDPFGHSKSNKKSLFDNKLNGKLYPYDKFLPGIFRNHFAYRYFVVLEKSRKLFEEKNHFNANGENMV